MEGRAVTAIKPIENRRVRAVASERYPLNKVCAHPECTEPAVDPHHAFPRSAIGGASWFVEIETEIGELDNGPLGDAHEWKTVTIVIPHVTGLCRAHHDLCELREAWIRYDLDERVWSWWDKDPTDGAGPLDFHELGELNPQPGSQQGKPKTRKRLKGDARRKRRTISIKVPNDTENGGELWDEMLDNIKERLVVLELYAEGDEIPNYEAVMAVANDWLTS